MKNIYLTLCLFLLSASIAEGETPWPPINPKGKQIPFNWSMNDGGGYVWDITAYGSVNDGTNDAYDGGMILQIQGNQFTATNGRGTLAENGREVMIGPWTYNKVQVYRYVYIDPDIGYCRWVDVFRNSGPAQTIKLRYYSNLGTAIQTKISTTGKSDADSKDWGMLTGNSNSDDSRPAIIHFWGTKKSKIRPSVRISGDDIYYDFNIELRTNTPAALCFFECQRNNFASAQEDFKQFSLKTEIRKIPRELRKLLVNMPSVFLDLGDINLPRNETNGMITLRDEKEIIGQILNKSFTLNTSCGKIQLDANKVLGFHHPQIGDTHVMMVLSDGQIVEGKLEETSISMKLKEGKDMEVALNKILYASYPISKEKPEEIMISKPMISLRSGARLAYSSGDVDYTFLSEYGRCKLNPESLREIRLDTPEGGLHLAVFRNGSSLSGLLIGDQLEVNLELGDKLKMPRQSVKGFIFPLSAKELEADPPALPTIILKNEDTLRGTFVDKNISLKSTGDKTVSIEFSDLKLLKRREEAFAGVEITTHSGKSVSGQVVNKILPFKLGDGMEIPVYVGHINQISVPGPKGATPATQPTSKPTAEPAKPAPTTPEAIKKAKEAEILEKMKLRRAAVRNVIINKRAVAPVPPPPPIDK